MMPLWESGSGLGQVGRTGWSVYWRVYWAERWVWRAEGRWPGREAQLGQGSWVAAVVEAAGRLCGEAGPPPGWSAGAAGSQSSRPWPPDWLDGAGETRCGPPAWSPWEADRPSSAGCQSRSEQAASSSFKHTDRQTDIVRRHSHRIYEGN